MELTLKCHSHHTFCPTGRKCWPSQVPLISHINSKSRFLQQQSLLCHAHNRWRHSPCPPVIASTSLPTTAQYRTSLFSGDFMLRTDHHVCVSVGVLCSMKPQTYAAQLLNSRRHICSNVFLIFQMTSCNAVQRGDSLFPELSQRDTDWLESLKWDPLQYSCLENPIARGTWWATIQRVSKSQTGLSMSIDRRKTDQISITQIVLIPFSSHSVDSPPCSYCEFGPLGFLIYNTALGYRCTYGWMDIYM